MKYILLFILFIAKDIKAQSTLNYDKRFVECEDKWVAFEASGDGSYTYGFIYIDEQSGLTFNREGTFVMTASGEFLPEKDTFNIKARLEPNNVLVAIIPESKYQELNITAIPEWLKYYKTDTNSIERLYRWGYLYNSWHECAKALTYLKKAEQIDLNYEGLAVELAFSYNCLEEYDKAEEILETEIKNRPRDAYVNKEYIYTLIKNNKIEKAEKQFNQSIKTLEGKQFNAENCFNILARYYSMNDKEKFNEWYKQLQKQPNENKMIDQYADKMKEEINK